MIYARVSLDGEAFLIGIDDERPETEDGVTFYPLSFLHESSGMRFEDAEAESTQPDEVIANYGFKGSLTGFYWKLYGRAPADSAVQELPAPEAPDGS
jgi:hypothetical protein